MKIVKRKITELIAAEYNPRKINKVQEQDLKDSLTRFGLVDPIIININEERKNIVIGGHQRLRVWADLGNTEIDCNQLDLTLDKERELNIRLNKNGGSFDDELVKEYFDYEELTEWGFTPDELFDKEETTADGLIDDDEIPETKESKVKRGDIWKLGEHRIMCGDSTSVNDMDNLMKNKKAKLSFTSPPYNAGKSELLSGNTHTTDNKYNTYNDNQKQTDYLDLLIGFTNNALLNSEYLICNIQSLAGNKVALIDYLYKYKNNFIDVAIWDKGHGAPAMAKNVMTSAWEYMFFISSKENATRAIPEANFRGTIPNIYRGKPQRNNEFSKVHAATFPIDLPIWVIEFTKNKDIILDQFLGTGTTLIAAQKLNRICYGMELDENYCDIIIERWEQFTGLKAKKING